MQSDFIFGLIISNQFSLVNRKLENNANGFHHTEAQYEVWRKSAGAAHKEKYYAG